MMAQEIFAGNLKMTTTGPDTLSFEEAMAELESWVKKLEGGRLPLEEAIQAYERGTLLKKHCEEKLQAAKMRVEQISLTADGSPRIEGF